jgi:CxxC motif-containing protein
MKEINKVTVDAPVKIGDVFIANVCGTGVDIVATNNDEGKH